jgi:hypothetical protein
MQVPHDTLRRLLVIYAGHEGGRTFALLGAVKRGVERSEEAITLRAKPALAAGIDDLLWAQALLIGTPEHFGYMAGALKDFMDRTYYPAEGKTVGLPYALFVSASNDGSGAVSSVERIAVGYRWKRVADPVIVKGEVDHTALARCAELGATLAAGLNLRIW